MESLILFWLVVTYLVKNVAEDTYHGVRGTTSPRREARQRRRKALAKSRTLGAVRGYVADLVEDATADATEARRHRRERKRRERERAEAWEAIARRADDTAREQQEEVDIPLDDPDDRPAYRPTPYELDESAKVADRIGWRQHAEWFRQRAQAIREGRPEPLDPFRANDDPETTEPGESTTPPAPEATPGQTPAGDPDAGEDARVIPLFPTKEDPNMATDASGEATGLASAMQYAAELQHAYEAHAVSGDTFVASLANGQVSGDAVAAAQQAREYEQMAAAAWGQCHEALADQIKVKEAYDATPGAGSREFVTSE